MNGRPARGAAALALWCGAAWAGQAAASSWRGTLRDAEGHAVAAASLELRGAAARFSARTGEDGAFAFDGLAVGTYTLRVRWAGRNAGPAQVEIGEGVARRDGLRLSADGTAVELAARDTAATASTGGEELSSTQVSAMPLNKRDFSQLLLLASGTQTDANGAANFTQQFTINGQRGAATVFAMDGIDTTDPEMGGATFSNFNVDAIQEIRSSSGVLPAEIGHGAAGYTEVISKSGTNDAHGSVFEFVRNAALDARNFFDRRSVAQPGRIPPFARNEFGFTLGGPLEIPKVYDGRNRSFVFVQYQGFRQVLGTTQILSVPTAAERAGRDSSAFPGDVLLVPVSPKIAPVLARYPLPNDPQGPYGARTYATSSKVRTVSDQFSARVDHRLSERGQLFARFNLNNVDGPITNPNQTALDPSFAIPFFDHQRNAGLRYTRTQSAHFTWDSELGFERSTPNFPTINTVQPALTYGDGLYEPFNAAAGSIIASFGNLFQARQNFTWTRGRHTWKAGAEVRLNRDVTLFGTSPNGTYTFGGGAAYAPVAIRSVSGAHNLAPGEALPDALTGLLTATPFTYTVTAAPPLFAQGERMGNSAVRREAYAAYVQDAWKATSRVQVSYGLRYEVNTPIHEAQQRASGLVFENGAGQGVNPFSAGAQARFLIHPQPQYATDWHGWGPRLAVDWSVNSKTTVRAGGAIMTMLPNLWQDNLVTGDLPFVVTPLMTAAPGAPLPFENAPLPLAMPQIYTPGGQLVFASGRTTAVPANTEMDVLRFERDLAALSPDRTVRALNVANMATNFHNGYIASYTAGVERELAGEVKLSAAYVATAGIGLPRIDFPNGYSGAAPGFAPYTMFNGAGQVAGGYGPITIMTNASHSTYHSLQAAATKTSLRAGLGFQASYTFSRSIDDTSAVLGGLLGGPSSTILQTTPQDPRNLRGEKGPSTFDATHSFALSAIQELRLERFLPGPRRLTSGWQVIGMAALTSGNPFSVFSGIQQTGIGSNGSDRPDQVGTPALSTSRTVREDYFGRGADNASYFFIPVNVPGGSGPNQGRFGTLGRNTFRGPAFHNFDCSVIKNTAIGPAGNPERAVAQFRAEFFNVFNVVNFGLPANIVRGPGFGIVNHTAGPSRQIQLSVKILF